MRADVVSQGRKADYAYGDRRAPSCIEATPDFRLHGHFWATMGRPIGREWKAATCMTIQRDRKIDGLGVRGVLHGLDALLDRLKCRSEHGCGQLGNALAIADSGFDPFLDQPLL